MDIALTFNNGVYDIATQDNDIATDESLESAIITSLFADRRASPPVDDRTEGHWADTNDNRWGSALWQYTRTKLTPQTAERLRAAAVESLQWIIDDRIADAIAATVTIENRDTAKIVITITRDGVADDYTFAAAFAASLPQ